MNSNLHFRINNVLFRLNRTCSKIATLFLLFFLLSGYEVYATSITVKFNQPAPVFFPATVDLTLPAVTLGSSAIDDIGDPAPITYSYWYDPGCVLDQIPYGDEVHIHATGRYYIKGVAINPADGSEFSGTAPGWVTVYQTVCSGFAYTMTPSGFNFAPPVYVPDLVCALLGFTKPLTPVTLPPTYTWTAPVIAGELAASSLTGGTAQPVASANFSQTLTNETSTYATATYTVTGKFTTYRVTKPVAGVCSWVITPTTFTFTWDEIMTVNPIGSMNAPVPISQVVCNTGTTTLVTFTTPKFGIDATTTYEWVNNQPGIGLAASGNAVTLTESSGYLPTFTAINLATAPVYSTVTVTPTFTFRGVSCKVPPKTKAFDITVNPTGQVNQPPDQVVCHTGSTASVTFSTINTGGTTSGTTTYTWTNNTPGIGLDPSGTGDLPSFIASNTSTSTIIATITVTPHYTNEGVTCDGPSKNFLITIDSLPVITGNSPVTCVGGTPIDFTRTGGNDGGVWSVDGGGTITQTSNTTARFFPTSAGCFSVTYTSPSPGSCAGTKSMTVFPTFPSMGLLIPPANTCNSAFILPDVTPVPDFYVEYNIDGVGWTVSPTVPTTPGCHTITARYVLGTACGLTPPGTPGLICSVSDVVSVVIFPPAPLAPTVNAPCGPIVVTPPPTIAGFDIQYSFDDGSTWGANTPPLADNCIGYKIKTRYSLAAACGLNPITTTSTIAPCVESPATTRKVDNTAPTITNPASSLDVTVACVAVVPAVNLATITATDNCIGAVIISHVGDVITAGSCVNKYSIARTYRATDVCGNTSDFLQTITVNDNIAPTITTPVGSLDVTVACVAVVPAVNLATITATDNCIGVVTISHVDDVVTAGSCVNKYSIARTYRATDICGNTSDFLQTITVNDNIAPTITTPVGSLDVTVACVEVVPVVNLASVTATDNCVGVVTVSHFGDVITAGTCVNKYSIARTYRATDICGNTSDFLQTITVNDNIAPTITTPALSLDVTVACVELVPAVNLATITATDNCSGVVTISHVGDVISALTCVNKYIIARTYRATDVCNNTSDFLQTITVNDNIAPTITTPVGSLDVTVACVAVVPAVNLATITATDNCIGVVTISHVGDVITAGSCVNKYSIARTYRATDVCNNTSDFLQTITVNDNIAPTISGVPASANYTCAALVPVASIASVSAADNCTATVTITVADATTPGSCINKFTVIRTWTATDVCGNTATASQTITVNDNVAPTISGVPVAASYACAGLVPVASIASVTAADNCTASVTITVADATIPGACINKFTVTRTWTATDICGNASTASQTITVNDNVAPVISSVPGPLTLACLSDVPGASVTSVIVSDNCTSSVTITVADMQIVGAGGMVTIIRTWTATDVCSNAATASQTITVNDKTPPVITSVPGPANYACEGSVPGANSGSVTVSDNCTAPVSVVVADVKIPGSCLNSFTIIRTWTATDGAGNTATASQTITLKDNVAPVIVTLPGSLDATVQCSNTVGYLGLPSATDNCSGVTIHFLSDVKTPDPTCASAYKRVRKFNFTDGCGNTSATFVQTISVIDNIAPVVQTITGSLDATLQCSDYSGIAKALTLFPTGADNCVVLPIRHLITDITTPDKDCANAYKRVRTWNFTDSCGNASDDFVQTITVIDITAPVVITVKGSLDANLQCSNSAGLSTALALMPSATDNCSVVPTIHLISDVTTTNATCANAYIRVRTWNFTDGCGNTSPDFIQTITVIDNTAPVVTTIKGSLDANLQCSNSVGIADALALKPSAIDNCTVISTIHLVSDLRTPDATCANAYTRVRTWNFTDGCGNTSTNFVQTITVIDNTAPVITGSISVTTVEGCSGSNATPPVKTIAELKALGLNVSDGCTPETAMSVTSSDISTGTNPVVVTRTYIVTDGCGNMATRVYQTINVKLSLSAAASPMAVTCTGGRNGKINLAVSGGTTPFTYSWTGSGGFTSTSKDLMDLSGGVYNVTVTDGLGCTKTTTATVDESLVRLALSFTGTNASKSGAKDGTIDATLTGGTAPFKFSWSGPDSFTALTEDLTGLGYGSYTLNVSEYYGCSGTGSFVVLDPPTANDDAVTTNEDVPVTFNIVTNDTDADGVIVANTIDMNPSLPGQQNSFTIPRQGTFTVNSMGDVSFVPVQYYNGTTTPIYYTVMDNSGLISNQGKITVVVISVNNPPVIADVPKSGPEDTDIPFTVTDFTSKFSDIDGDAMTKIKVLSLPKNGTLKLNGVAVSVNTEISVANITNLTFTPSTNWYGSTSFDWNGFDGTVYAVLAEQVNIIITSVNDGPVAVDDKFETKVNKKLFGIIITNDYDVDINDIITVDIIPVKSTTNGTLVLSANGDFTYQPKLDFVGSDSFTYKICDNGTPTLCSTAVVTISILRDESCEVIVPNVFTPNGDGINDYLKVTCLYNYDNPEMQVFNRNGNLLFKKDHYGNIDYWGSEDQALWNGRSQNNLDFFGSDLPVGTYYYVFKVGNGKVLTGFIFLAK